VFTAIVIERLVVDVSSYSNAFTYLFTGRFAVCLYLHVMLGENEFLVFVNERNYFSPRRLLN